MELRGSMAPWRPGPGWPHGCERRSTYSTEQSLLISSMQSSFSPHDCHRLGVCQLRSSCSHLLIDVFISRSTVLCSACYSIAPSAIKARALVVCNAAQLTGRLQRPRRDEPELKHRGSQAHRYDLVVLATPVFDPADDESQTQCTSRSPTGLCEPTAFAILRMPVGNYIIIISVTLWCVNLAAGRAYAPSEPETCRRRTRFRDALFRATARPKRESVCPYRM
jgi:hypothetical protein